MAAPSMRGHRPHASLRRFKTAPRPQSAAATAAAAANERASAPPPPTTPPTTPPPAALRERHTSWLRRGAADARGSPFHELGLAARGDDGGAGRAPKRRNYARLEQQQAGAAAVVAPLRPPAQPSSLAGDRRAGPPPPVFLDVGCGSGRFLLLLSRRLRQLRAADPANGGEASAPEAPMTRLLLGGLGRHASPQLQLVGIDAQPALVSRANAWARALDQKEEEEPESAADEWAEGGVPFGCRFVAGDASKLLELEDGLGIGSSSPPLIAAASINFPDPVLMDRARGGKNGGGGGGGAAPSPSASSARRRRCPALSVEFAGLLASRMAPGAPLMVQSECAATAAALVEGALLASGRFEALAPPPPPPDGGARAAPGPWWRCPTNPLGVPTEREVYLEERARLGEHHDVWRALLVVRK